MVKVKICGVRSFEDIALMNQFHPDYIGFVFAKSKRQINIEEAVRLKKALDPKIQTVGVFVNESPKVICDLLLSGVIDMAQLHGQETPDEVLHIQKETGKKVIKAIAMKENFSEKEATKWRADYLLLDHTNPGGGTPFNWALLEGKTLPPFFLAGGLTPENVEEAIVRFSPFCVDVSSGVEHQGRKDANKIELLIRSVRK